jgi:hypothetical protein
MRWPWGIWRASANIIAMACSAVVMEFPNGVFMTTMPVSVAFGTSMLSTPMPARPTTFRFFAASMMSGVTFVSERTAKTIVIRNDGFQLIGLDARFEIDIASFFLEDFYGEGIQRIADQYFGCLDGGSLRHFFTMILSCS